MQINAITQKPYTGTNAKALEASGMPSNVWATYKQWQSINQQVRKGSHGIRLVRVDGKKIIPMNVFNQSQVDLIDDANNFAIAAIASQVDSNAPKPIEAPEPVPQAAPEPVKVSTPKPQNKPESSLKAFQEAVKLTCGNVGKYHAMPDVLNCVLLQYSGDGILLSMANLKSNFRVSYKILGQFNFFPSMLFEADKLLAFSKILKGDLELFVDDAGLIANGMKLAKSELFAGDYPILEDIGEPLSSFEIKANTLNKVSYCVSKEETRFYLMGVYAHNRDGNLYFAATDGHRLSNFKAGELADIDPDVIMPSDFIKVISGLPNGLVTTFRSHVRFHSGNISITSLIIDGTFPDYQRVIPTENLKQAIISKKQWLEIIKNLKPLAKIEGKLKPVKWSFAKKLASTNGIELPFSFETSDDLSGFEVGLNCQYLEDAFKNIAGDSITLQFRDSGSPIRIESDDLVQVVMPLRV